MIVAMLEGPDLLIVAVIVMVMFGAKKLPELARGLGQAKREFEDALKPDAAPQPAPRPPKAIVETVATDAPSTVTLSRAEYEELQALRRAQSGHEDGAAPA